MSFIRQVMEIGDGENSFFTEDGFGISGEFDMDNLSGMLDFSLPYFIPLPDSTEKQFATLTAGTGIDTNRLKKFDIIRLFFLELKNDMGGEVETYKITETIENTDGTTETIESNGYKIDGIEMSKIFDGFIDTIKQSTAKTTIAYDFTALGTLGLSNYRNMSYEHKTGTAYELIQTLLQISGLQKGQFNVGAVQRNIIPANKVRFIDVNAINRVLITEGGKALKKVLDGLKSKYALIIHQSGDGYMNVMTPFSLLSARDNETLNVNAWQFDINEGTLYEINYGDLGNNYNAVVILGFPNLYGVALDPIAVENNNGIVNYLILENRNLNSEEECQKVARDNLLEMERNYIISVKTKFSPELMVGQPFQIKDNDRFTGNELLIIKRYVFSIDKQDVSCWVSGFAHGATLIPEDIALSNIGVLDVDILSIRTKELDVTAWKDL